MLNSPEGLKIRKAAIGIAFAWGSIGLQSTETSQNVNEVPRPTEHKDPMAVGASLVRVAGMSEERASRTNSVESTTTTQPMGTATGRSIGTFEVTCYNLRGKTASGLQSGYGRVSVDPMIIPLGTRLYISGYGEAVAADTGSLINGHTIDIWKPTESECAQWGRKEVEVTQLP